MPRWFGTDGIRGMVGEWPMTPEFVLQLGRAAGAVICGQSREATVVIGRDTRQSSSMLQEALDAGLMASGVHVVDLGVVPTPGVAWLVRHINADAGVVLSASHNPSDQNGIKFFHRSGRKLPEELESQIEAEIEKGMNASTPQPIRPRLGHVHNGEIFQELYIRDLISEHPGMNLDGVRLVMDCANGAASLIAPEVFGRLGAEVIAIHASPNGLNINLNSGSEHVRRSMEEVNLLIEHHQAHFGLAFDGDADRVVFVDEQGSLIDGDHMLGMLSRYFDERQQLLERSVVATVMSNRGLKNRLEETGITFIETPVGDKYVADQIFALMASETSRDMFGLGGEQAGHILIVDENHPSGDGIRTALFVIRAFLESGVNSLARFADRVGKTPQVIASAKIGSGPRLSRLELNALEANTLHQPGIIRVNLRYSGTEPLLRVMLESDGLKNEKELAQIALDLCRHAQETSGGTPGAVDILNVTCGGVINPVD